MTAGVDEPSPFALSCTRALAARLAAERQQEIADEMFDFIGAALPTLWEDEPLARLGKGTCLAMVELMLAMMEHAIPGDRAEPPVVAIEYACLIADRGLPLEDLLRAYRLGHARFARIMTDAITDLDLDPPELTSAVRDTERFLFAVVDVVSSRVGAVYLEQCQRQRSRTSLQRGDVVRALLEGDSIDIGRAEQSLGHRLTGPQLAFICWSDGDAAVLNPVVTAMQEVLKAPRPVVLPIEDFTLSGWFDMSRGQSSSLDKLRSAAGPAVHIALGTVLPGLSGFRRSRARAERVRRVIKLSGKEAPTLTRWVDVALVDALSADLDAARELVRSELRGLNHVGDEIATLRHTAQAFVVSGFSYSAVAGSMHIHRNTALQRVKKAQELRGSPLTERPAELLAGLALIDTLGSALLDP
jgi:DNA-binding PucR family transcriptional regulator